MIPHLPAMHAHPSIIATIGKSCIPLMLLGTAWAGHGGNSPSPAPDAASKTELSRDTEHCSKQEKSNFTIWLKQQYCKYYMFEPINRQMQEWRISPESSPDGHQTRFILKLSDESYGISPLMDELQRIMQQQRREEGWLEELSKTAKSFRRLNLIVLIFAATVHLILLCYLICKIG